MKKISVNTKELSNDFANFLQDMMGKRSPHTVTGYRSAMCLFIDYQEYKIKRKLNEFTIDYFTKQNIEDFMKWLIEVRKVSKQTCNTRVSQICAFFKYMRNNPTYLPHYIELRDVSRVRMTVAANVLEPLSRGAIKALISALYGFVFISVQFSDQN